MNNEYSNADDFAHFLSYTGFSSLPPEEIERLRMAYEHGATPRFAPSEHRVNIAERNI